MGSLLILGFLIGMRHALDADHLAAVAAISTQQNSIRSTIKHGLIWGLGHTTTLFLFGSMVIWMDTIIPEQLATYLELAVGFMLVALGLDVLRRVLKDRIHFHLHRHKNITAHFHAHSHSGESDHQQSNHQHSHDQKFPYRTLFIGFMHGMAGSAALILLTMETIDSLWAGLIYMLLFGIGSMLGMAIISAIIAIPLRASANGLTWMFNSLQIGIGLLTFGLGITIIIESMPI
ncbi:MAG: urease accessory protein [Gammaproteobacteria bacterium]|jgi:ABC-type nickel/cobalt efflux system permease component RcnA|nr:urease accessory protein [Gammaproteobacteria bacterium]MBT3725918.1 urease accessory protein [Gammaproteobacteria bacterium]MBT4076142.1 urease accessory protein [Gammaproteobacteria bacterium]MBT4195857.1 urease accessory protein [Gammaproteobacteria bacterium]MBT4448965.1 urease accessory protein [Gammaproteobacteria bacterium]